MEIGASKKCRVVLCPALGRGHLTPMMGLAQALASTRQVSITIIFPTQGALESISKSVFAGLDVEMLVLESGLSDIPSWMLRQTVSVRSRGDSKPRIASLPIDFPVEEAALEPLLRKLLASPSPPVCLIHDSTISWPAAPARKLSLPRYALYICPAHFMALSYSAQRGLDKSKDFSPKDLSKSFGLERLSDLDVCPFIWDAQHPLFPMHNLFHQLIIQSDGVLINTFYDLESSAVDALRGEFLMGGNVFTVGPLNMFGDSKSTAFASAQDQCIGWLDSKAADSVVFLSFGSWENLPDDQISELAIGLELSNCSFLWVMNEFSGSKVESLLPDGFRSGVIESGRGLIVKGWAPQQSILSHPAICGFVTQCGWNSVLECVSLAGVPIVCWPFGGDQLTTCRFLVDGLKIAVDVREDENGRVSRAEVKRVLEKITVGDEAKAMGSAAKAWRQLAWDSMNPEHGSSMCNLKAFLTQIGRLPAKSL